jgi:DNA-binding Lrp family transcriptional regulator
MMSIAQLDRRLLNDFQRGFPLTPRPFAEIAAALDVPESTVIERFKVLQADGKIGRIGPVVRPHTIGFSTLAAVAAPAAAVEPIAQRIALHPCVNHCYERSHDVNIWFVVTAADAATVALVLAEIEAETGLAVLDLPLEAAYHIDLGFPL